MLASAVSPVTAHADRALPAAVQVPAADSPPLRPNYMPGRLAPQVPAGTRRGWHPGRCVPQLPALGDAKPAPSWTHAWSLPCSACFPAPQPDTRTPQITGRTSILVGPNLKELGTGSRQGSRQLDSEDPRLRSLAGDGRGAGVLLAPISGIWEERQCGELDANAMGHHGDKMADLSPNNV